ncbi:MAG: hypothetical protein IJ077_06110 [Eubacterium sp.]|nr:hypothetical protein [Eubacterium sp.]MBR1531681.1 hypothetical protein [Eubacterium sp.]
MALGGYMEYEVTFIRNDVYIVEADNEDEALSKAYENLKNDRLNSSVADLHYNEYEVEEIEE